MDFIRDLFAPSICCSLRCGECAATHCSVKAYQFLTAIFNPHYFRRFLPCRLRPRCTDLLTAVTLMLPRDMFMRAHACNVFGGLLFFFLILRLSSYVMGAISFIGCSHVFDAPHELCRRTAFHFTLRTQASLAGARSRVAYASNAFVLPFLGESGEDGLSDLACGACETYSGRHRPCDCLRASSTVHAFVGAILFCIAVLVLALHLTAVRLPSAAESLAAPKSWGTLEELWPHKHPSSCLALCFAISLFSCQTLLV
ncbi:hypothetical protein TraAM80_01153 [Trypanosoma rangeli]|uniref:Uncharacterized protein n=1 Tax=Trypanosoma rangeli TaxID=5698 RepID=A0A422NZX9_TRYRA|nr:uncharacterized protein TraAM80_01153 [Trypanosoma rangeli]RNF11026.1 hypothetical protein TraAM80_01153 [Trypanosoma rangeli]|eukprot:RNF11026.1 hypothetical protein TraAM80_01153 [Trypanosoma rangeli]